MGQLDLYVESTEPPAPPAGYLRFFQIGTTLKHKDSSGTVITYAAGLTQEQVEDYVGALLQDSSTVNVTYNDAGNQVTFDVIASAVDHDALLNFVANEHVDHSAVAITAGTGLTGGGNITASRTLSIANTGVTAATYQSPTTVTSFAVNAQGQITGTTNNFIAIPSTQVTDFNEAAQDAVGGALIDSSSVDFTYSDGSNSIQAFVIPGGVDHNGLANLATGNPHTQYLLSSAAATTYQPLDSDLTAIAALAGTGIISRTGTGTAVTRTITSGTGITISNGDGVSGNPTASISNTGVTAGTYGNNAVVPQITVNAQGQITNVASSTIAIGAANITDFAEQVDDRVDALTLAGTGISKTYNDISNTLTITNTDLGSAAVTTHEAALDPHPQYLTAAEGSAAYQPLDSDLTAVASLAGTGLVVRTGSGTATTRFIAVSTGLFGSAVDGVSGNPTIGIGNTGVTAATYGSATQVSQIAINAQGQATSASNVTIAIPSTQITDFNEAAQDAVGGILTDSTSIDFTYNDAGNQITAAVLPAGVNHNLLLNGGGNTHIDHSAVTLNAGTYMSATGLGDLTASRTINHANSAVTPATYGGVNAIPVLGIGATGHVDSASTVNPTAALLTGLAAGTNTPVISTDTLLAAIAKLQAQLDAVASAGSWTELVKTADEINSSNVTFTNITDLQFSAVAGRSYYMEYTLLFRTIVTTTGLTVSMGTPNGAVGDISLQVNLPIAADGTAALYTGSITAFGDAVVSTGVQTAQPTWFICNMKGVFRCTTSGIVLPQFRSEVNGSNVNCGQGSVALIREFT